MKKAWRDVTPLDKEWPIKQRLDRQLLILNTCSVIVLVLFVLAFWAFR